MRYRVLTAPIAGARRVVDTDTQTVVAWIRGADHAELTGAPIDHERVGHDIVEHARAHGDTLIGTILTDVFLQSEPRGWCRDSGVQVSRMNGGGSRRAATNKHTCRCGRRVTLTARGKVTRHKAPRAPRPEHRYSAHGLAGCVQQRRARSNGRLVGVYHSRQAGIDDDDENAPWSTVCEEHATCMGHLTRALALAHAADPEGWCEDCRDERDQVAS